MPRNHVLFLCSLLCLSEIACADPAPACTANPGVTPICGIDPAGFEMISGDFLLRYEFETLAVDSDHICSNISKTAYSIP